MFSELFSPDMFLNHKISRTSNVVNFIVNEGLKYTNVLESFRFKEVFKYVNELESLLLSGQYNLDFFCTEVRGILPWDCKNTIFVVQILRILAQKSTQKNKYFLREFQRFHTEN